MGKLQGVAIEAREGDIGGGGGACARVTSLEGSHSQPREGKRERSS